MSHHFPITLHIEYVLQKEMFQLINGLGNCSQNQSNIKNLNTLKNKYFVLFKEAVKLNFQYSFYHFILLISFYANYG